MTPNERKDLEAMLIAFFPTLPAETGRAWMLTLADRRADDVSRAIPAMARAVAFPTLKALSDALEEITHERCRAENEAASAKQLAAWADSTIDLAASRAKLARIAAAVRRKAPREEIEAIALEGVKP